MLRPIQIKTHKVIVKFYNLNTLATITTKMLAKFNKTSINHDNYHLLLVKQSV